MKHLLYSFLLFSLLFAGCDYLDMVPEKDIETVESIFEMRSNAEKWMAGAYTGVEGLIASYRQNVSYFGADEFVASEPLRNQSSNGIYAFGGFKIAEGLQMSQAPYGDVWSEGGQKAPSLYASIRSCNIFLENIMNVYNMRTTEKLQWAAEVKALKAFIYFELVRRYGPIVLVPENISVDEDMAFMRKQRVHVDTCFNAIVKLLDEAAVDLLPGNERSSDRSAYFSREAALSLKARVLLYAASPMFNGNEFYSDFTDKEGKPLFSTQYDPEKWRLAAEAADEAALACELAGHKLYDRSNAMQTELLGTMLNVEHSVLSEFNNPEFILEWKDRSEALQNLFLPRLKSTDTEHYLGSIMGCVSPSLKMVEMYYTENGLPIEMDNTWDYAGRYHMSREASDRYKEVVALNTDVLQLHLRREPRFYACIAADRTYWQRGPYSGNYNLAVQVYKGERFGSQFNTITNTGWQNIMGYWIKKTLNSELKTREYTDSKSKNVTLPLIRLAEVYLMQAEAWNEYEGPSSKVFNPLNKVRARAGIMDVETAWRGYSRAPGKIDTKEGMRDIIRQEINIEFAFEGHRFWNLRRWKIAHEVLNQKQYGWNVLGESAQSFYNNFEGPILVGGKYKFTAPRDYLFPLNAEEVLISSLVQNPGW